MNNNWNSFEAQLQNRLHQIESRRSQKKLKSTKLLKIPNQNSSLELYEAVQQKQHKQISYSDSENDASQKQQQQKSVNKLVKYDDKSSKKQIKHSTRLNQYSNFSVIQNQELKRFIFKYFGKKSQTIYLDKFVQKIITQYQNNNQLTDQHIQSLYLLFQNQLTTTDSEIISLNALEVCIKSSGMSFSAFIEHRFSQVKFDCKKIKLQKDYANMKKSLEQRKQQMNIQQNKYREKIKSMKQKQQVLQKKQHQLCKRQKQLSNKLKNYKMILEEKAQKLTMNAMNQLTSLSQKIQKKINTFQRNIKYKIQNLHNKINQLHRLRQFDEAHLRKNITDELVKKSKKQDKNNIYKLQKQIKQKQNNIQILSSQKDALEQQGQKLLKICSSLQVKVSKLQKQIKNSKVDNEAISNKYKQLQYLYKQKQYENQQLIKNLTQSKRTNKQTSDSDNKKKIKKQKTDKTKIKQIVTVYESLGLSQTDKQAQQHNILQNCQNIIQIIQFLLSENIQCRILIDRIVSVLVNKINCLKHQQSTTLLSKNKSLSSFFHSFCTDKELEPNQNYAKLINLKNSDGWKICFLAIMISHSTICQWLQYLNSILQNQQISAYFAQELEKSNYLGALIQKVYNQMQKCNASQIISILDSLMEIILASRATNSKQNIYKLIQNDIYKRLVDFFMLISKDNKNTFEIQQKISIIIQRMAYFYGTEIIISKIQCKAFKKQLTQFQNTDSILVPNFKSVIDTVTIS